MKEFRSTKKKHQKREKTDSYSFTYETVFIQFFIIQKKMCNILERRSDDGSEASCPHFLPQNLNQTLQPEEEEEEEKLTVTSCDATVEVTTNMDASGNRRNIYRQTFLLSRRYYSTVGIEPPTPQDPSVCLRPQVCDGGRRRRGTADIMFIVDMLLYTCRYYVYS